MGWSIVDCVGMTGFTVGGKVSGRVFRGQSQYNRLEVGGMRHMRVLI